MKIITTLLLGAAALFSVSCSCTGGAVDTGIEAPKYQEPVIAPAK